MPTDSSSFRASNENLAGQDEVTSSSLLDRLGSPSYLKEFRDAKGRTLLMRAIVDDDPELVAFLAPRSDLVAFVTLGEEEIGQTPLMLAARLGRTACVKVLLQHDPAEQCAWHGGRKGYPPALDQAVANGHTDCVALMAPWSNLMARSLYFPLIVAAQNGHLDMLRLLLPFCSLNDRNRYRNALEAVVNSSTKSPDRDACFDLLLQQPGIEVLRPGQDGFDLSTYKVLFDAIGKDRAHMVQGLLPFFDVNVLRAYHSGGSWENYSTPLHQIVYWQAHRCLDVVLPLCQEALLLKAVSGDYAGKTPVELAIDQAMRPRSLTDENLARRMADSIVAHGVTLGLDIPLPPMTDQKGQPLSHEQAMTLWPLIHVAQETRALRATISSENLEPDRAQAPPRARL